MASTLETVRMDIGEDNSCFFAEKVPQVVCSCTHLTFASLLINSNETPADCRSELEHLLLLAGFFDLKLKTVYNHIICSNHRDALLNLWHRKDNCHLCVEIFKKKKRSTANLRRISKAIAFSVWHNKRLNVYYRWICTSCRIACTTKYNDTKDVENPFQWLLNENIADTPSTAGVSLPPCDYEYEPFEGTVSPGYITKAKREFRQWLTSTGYEGRWRSTDNYRVLSQHDQRVFRNQTKDIFRHILRQFVANDADLVWEDMIDDEIRKPAQTKQGEYELVIRSLTDAYSRAEHWSTKRQLLSIVAADLPARVLKSEFPGLTDWKIKAARSQAFFQGRGTISDTIRAPVERYKKEQIIHFITFIQSPHITTDMPFGEQKMKLSSGEKLIVPDVIRNAIPSRIVSQYLAYCEETIDGNGFKPLASSSLFAILQKCKASTRKSLAGLDNFSSDGATAFDQLRELCNEMTSYGIKPEEIVHLKQALHDGRNYLKLDFKTHVSLSSTIADHCSTFGLSDPSNSAWRCQCEHEHTDECESCLGLQTTLFRMRSIIESNTNVNEGIRHRLLYRLDHNVQYINDWKKHLVRTVHQDASRKYVLHSLDDSSVFLITDWAMKWIPTRYRECQREFFGKRGLPWHITYAIRTKSSLFSSAQPSSSADTRAFEHRTFCHVFDDVKQDGLAVISILTDVLQQLKRADANLTGVYIRADNAGCYKGSDLLLAAEQIYKTTGILVRRIDFSDSQSGKSHCDRMASVIKANVRRFINEKNDCVTSSDFVDGAKSTRYTTVMACRLPSSSAAKKNRWQGIQSFNNIQYEFVSNEMNPHSEAGELDIKVTVWKAFRIGPGQVFHWSKMNTPTNSIIPIQVGARYDNVHWQVDSVIKGQVIDEEMIDTNSFDDDVSRPDQSNDTLMKENSMDVDTASMISKRSSAFVTFDCPESHCIMQFRREDRLRAHMLLGSHKILLPSFKLLDKAMLMYKESVESDNYKQVPPMPTITTTSTVYTRSEHNLSEGWALFRPRPRVALTGAQRSYLAEKYNEGEQTGTKWDPARVAEDMQVVQCNGRFVFEPDQFLTTSQIKSYFSRLTRERRQQGNQSQMIISTSTASISSDDEDQQLQDEEDENHFNSAMEATEAYDLLDNAIHILDDITQQQQSQPTTSSRSLSLLPPRRTRKTTHRNRSTTAPRK